MFSIAIKEVLAKLPVAQLGEALREFVQPFVQGLPDRRLARVVPQAVQGILGSQTPVITGMAQSTSLLEADVWPAAKRIYRFLNNPRLSADTLFEGLYRMAQHTVAHEQPPYLVVAIDPVNFEKPYTHQLEGVSTIYKSTPPNRYGKARLTRGYPAITATIVNTRVPATTYANWFSYTLDFISQNHEIRCAIAQSRQLFEGQQIRFVGDSGLDDQKIFEWISGEGCEAQFVIRASHLERLVEIYNPRRGEWEREALQDLVDTVPFETEWLVEFKHAGYTRQATIQIGWLCVRLPETGRALWVLVAYEAATEQGQERKERKERTLVLLTNVPVQSVEEAQSVYSDWRLRSRIEHGYRFDQEQGLDVEDMRVQTVERMRRLFALVLVAAQFVFHLMDRWPAVAVQWLREVGGKLGLGIDRDGPYLLLRGLSAVWQTVATLTHLTLHPFPHHAFPSVQGQRCG
jgi:hypothetical protein